MHTDFLLNQLARYNHQDSLNRAHEERKARKVVSNGKLLKSNRMNSVREFVVSFTEQTLVRKILRKTRVN